MKIYSQIIQSKLNMCVVQIIIATLEIVIIRLWFPGWLQVIFIGFILIGLLISLPITLLTNETITISSEGVEYDRFLFGMKVDWNGFNRIGNYWFRNGMYIRHGHSVTLKYTIPPNWKVYGGFLFYVFIPLSPFAKNWRDSELGQQIKQYAPHLFEKEKSA